MTKGEYTGHYVFQRPQKPNAWFMYQIFYIVANAETIEDAARETGLSHHYMSKIISRLENSMDVVLFKRGKTGLTLTPIGKKVYEQLKSVHGMLEDTTEMMELGRQGLLDIPLRVAAPYVLGATLIHAFSKQIKQEYPELHLDLSLLHYDQQSLVYNHDCGIVFDKPTRQNYCADYLFSQEQGIYASEAYLKKHGEPESLEDIIASGDIIPIKRKNPPNIEVPKWMKVFHNNYKDGSVVTTYVQNVLDRILWNEGFGILQKEHTLAYPVKQVLQRYAGKPKKVYFVYPEIYKNNKEIKSLREFLLGITKPLRNS